MFIISKYLDYVFKQTDLEYRRVVLSLFERNPGARLLDLGCGDGSFTLKIAEKIGTTQVYGVDTVEENLDRAGEKGIWGYRADLNERLPFEDESFDVIHANQVIEHLSNTDLFLQEVHRVLRKDGYCIISTPNLASFHNILYLLFGKQPPTAMVSDRIVYGRCVSPVEGPRHRRIFTRAALRELLEYHGFQIFICRGSGFYPFLIPIARVLTFFNVSHTAYITIKARKGNSDK